LSGFVGVVATEKGASGVFPAGIFYGISSGLVRDKFNSTALRNAVNPNMGGRWMPTGRVNERRIPLSLSC